ncbi:HAD-IIIC family phosphatase [Helicobacter sp. MIT 21-1697]|uniref:HAD-IIIC family phosphatase n=1 Tax=Helicobacter sp. MIT 21-1697 TaxID=2993733 RepID=UPI00224A7EB1|nr:HAD-IIIC family phosphatase [Helicobacter sp. MIT 21-1697]MCX2717898.1 HAD-IIIC family phosphatase [Helicobacter sp. MIT 21-1697]
MELDVFKEHITRKEILESARFVQKHTNVLKKYTINVHRNHAFEAISSIISPFLQKSGIFGEFNLSPYDDSFLFASLQEEMWQKADLEIVWIDFNHYKNTAILPYLLERLKALRNVSLAPILVIALDIDKGIDENLEDLKAFLDVSDCEVLFVSALLSTFDREDLIDEVKSKITGSRLSNFACVKLAQLLGLVWIPAFLLPNLKAIVCDLDNTLYRGILGEDGINGIILNEDYQNLQKQILSHKKQGFLLALASKNEEEDAKELFKTRKDFVLKWADFDIKKVSWNPKVQSLQEIAQGFNIGLDSILFIDDNLAEVQSVQSLGVKTILATSPSEVLRILSLFPQLKKINIKREDLLRSLDIKANAQRESLKELPKSEYFKSLCMQLEFCVNNMKSIERIEELLNKTNQFIANYTRPSLEQVREWIMDKQHCVVSVAMQDKLSDSGIIGIFVGKSEDSYLCLIDLCVSCRALGRKIEDIMLFQSLNLMADFLKIKKENVKVYYQKGARNAPFLSFLDSLNREKSENFVILRISKPDTSGLKINIKEVK